MTQGEALKRIERICELMEANGKGDSQLARIHELASSCAARERWEAFSSRDLFDLYQALSNTSYEVIQADLPIVEEARGAWITRNTREGQPA